MKNCNMILTEIQHNISVIIWKNDKHEHLTGEKILSRGQRRVIEQAKFTYCLLGKGFQKQLKTWETTS